MVLNMQLFFRFAHLYIYREASVDLKTKGREKNQIPIFGDLVRR